MVIRHNNAKAKDNHLSIKGLPSDLGEAKSELKSRIEEIDIDKNIIGKYQSQVDKLKNLKKDLKGLVDRFNTDVDKLANGAMVISIKKGEEVDYLVQTEDEMLDQLNKTKEINDKINQLNEERKEASKERQAEIDAEIANKKAEREETYKYASGLVDNMASAAVDMTKGVISGDPDKMVDTILGALAGIFSFLTKGIALGIISFKSAWDKHKAGEKLNDEDLKMLEQVQVDVVSEGSITSDPMTSDELDEVNQDISDTAFEGVGKITDWESAFAYGYAKLKQIHGIKYDEAKATEALNALKEKYPDNPKVVIGAFKFGGGRRKRSRKEENNSRVIDFRKSNSRMMNGNPVSDLPEVIDSLLQDFAQNTNLITYTDIWNFAKSCNQIQFGKMKKILDHFDDLEDDEKLQNELAEIIKSPRKSNSREKVSDKDLAKAKESGVVQMKPNGSWGIISIEKGEWWVPDYESEDAAKNALQAYHAGRFGNSDIRDEARKLFFELIPDEKPETIEKALDFGFGLAAKPQDLIDSLKEQIEMKKRGKNSMVPQADVKIADRYVATANNDNYVEILSKIATELGEKFEVPYKFDTPREFAQWAEHCDSISDRMFIVIDYVMGAVTGMKDGVRDKNSRQVNSNLSSHISKLNEKLQAKGYKANWDSENDQIEIKGKDSDIVTLIQEGNKLILSRWDDVVYISTDFDKVLKELVNQLGKN